MSTKNDKYSFIEQNFTTSENQCYNLNLNQYKKCSILVPVQSYSKLNIDKYCVSDDYEEKGKLRSWNKSFKTSTFATFNEDNNDLKKRWKNKNYLNITNKCTLSLHIAAYENSNEAVASDLFDDENIEGLKKEKLGSIKTSNHYFTDCLMNPFEFSRQQNENQRNKPEVAQFKASQRLLASQPPTTSQQIGNNGQQMPSGAGTASKMAQTGLLKEKQSIGFLTRQDVFSFTFRTFDLKTQKIVSTAIYSTFKAEEFIDQIPKICSTFKLFIVDLFEIRFDAETFCGKTGYDFCKELKQIFQELQIPSYFVATGNCLFSSLLLAANVDVKVDEKVLLILPYLLNDNSEGDKYGLAIGDFKFTPNGYQLVSYKRLPYLNFKDSPQNIFQQICGSNIPKKVVAGNFGPRNPFRKVFKPKTLTVLTCCLGCHIDKYIAQTCKWFFDKSLTKYHIIQTSVKEIHVFANYGAALQSSKPSIGKNILNILKINASDPLPITKTTIFPRSIPEMQTFMEDGQFSKYTFPKCLPKDCHRYQITVTIDEENLDDFKLVQLEIKNFHEMLQKADKTLKEKIPIIGLFDNSSVIATYQNPEVGYIFLEEWNGIYGSDCFISFDEKRPKFGAAAMESLKTKNTYVVFDFLKIMSMSAKDIKAKKEWGFTFTKNAENPVLLEFENFDGTKKVSSPSFLMAMFLRQHLKAIEKKVGEKPKEIALWIFEEGFNEIQMKRIKDGLGESCKLLKLGFTFVDAKDFTANFVQTRTISLID